MPKDAPKPPIPSPLSDSRTLSELQKTHASVKLKIGQRANSIIDFLNRRISQPQNLNLLTHSSAHRLAALIKDLISLHQSLYNALMDLADHTSLSEHHTVSSSREQALEDWAEEGERLGMLCYQAKKYREGNWRMPCMISRRSRGGRGRLLV